MWSIINSKGVEIMRLDSTGNLSLGTARGEFWLETVNQSLTNRDASTDLWLMPLVVEETNEGRYYRVYIRMKSWYRYTDESLPDFIKEKLAAISAYTLGRMDIVNKANGIFKDSIYMFNNQQLPPEFETIGWRGSQNLFILSLTETQLYRVLDDAGIQGQVTSQEGIG